MPSIDHDIMNYFIPFFVWLFFIFGVAGLAVGAGLAVYGNRMTGFFSLMNRWIPTQGYFNRRWIGVLFIAGGAFPLFTLARRLYENSFGHLLGGAIQSPVIAWSVEAGWWSLIFGNLLAIVVGVLLAFSPATLQAAGASAGRPSGLSGDTEERMYLTLDRWIKSSPRLTGIIIAAGALVVVLQFGLMLFGTFPR